MRVVIRGNLLSGFFPGTLIFHHCPLQAEQFSKVELLRFRKEGLPPNLVEPDYDL
jgi:hypothetical protein